MDISKQIEIYMDRPVDFGSEVILRANENGVYIDEWNITDKPQLTIDQLIVLVDTKGLAIQARKAQIQADIEDLGGFYLDENNFDLGLQALFDPCRLRVMEYMMADDYDKALRTIQTTPVIQELEAAKQQFITKFQSYMEV